jgi:DNA-binding response OmpR family regulator
VTPESKIDRDLSSAKKPSAPRAARIVLAEDDPQMRGLVTETLRGDGHEVIPLADGAQLLVRVTQQYRMRDPAQGIDLIVADVRMPIITGLAILKGLRDAHCFTPVILMTAFGDEQTRREALMLGALFFEKPFKMHELRGAVRTILGADRAR